MHSQAGFASSAVEMIERYANLLGWLKGAPATVATRSSDEMLRLHVCCSRDFTRGMAHRWDQFERFRKHAAGLDTHRASLVQGPKEQRQVGVDEGVLFPLCTASRARHFRTST